MSTLKVINVQNPASSFVNMVTGTDGSVSFGQVPVAPNSFQRNRLINPAMQIAQRGTTAVMIANATAITYPTVDRWYAYCTGANVAMNQIAGTQPDRNVVQFTGGSGVGTIGFGQRIESLNSYDMAGQICTLSCKTSNSALTTVTWTAYYANSLDTFGSLAAPTRIQFATGTFSVDTSLRSFNAQITIPTAATTGIEVVFTVAGQTSGTWLIGNVQFETGAVATAFERRLYPQELALCQRYYYSTVNNSIYTATTFQNANSIYPPVNHPVPMRATPAITTVKAGGGTPDCGVTPFPLSGSVRFISGATGNVTDWNWTASAEL